jgi:diguanylate cyclase (GGDEF)-like protein/PAS domain S-box-containing protein
MIKLNNKAAIKSAQLRQLFSACNVSLVTSTLLAMILAYIQRHVIASSVIYGWLVLIFMVAVSRAALVQAYNRAQIGNDFDIERWMNRFRYGVLAVGIVWGSSGILMFPVNNIQHQMFLIFMLAGLSAGGVVSFSADLVCAVMFSVASLLPVIVRLAVASDHLSLSMSAAGLLYLGFMVISLRHINNYITDHIILRLDSAAREELVRISGERYRLLLKHSPVGIIHFDTNYLITYCNDYLAQLLHSSVDNIVGSGMAILNDEPMLAVLKKTLKGESILYEGHYHSKFSDNKLWLEVNSAPSFDNTGQVAGGIAILRNITERKQTEEILRISEIAFESQSGMIVTDTDATILRVNKAFCKLTGYQTQEALGQTPRLLSSGRHDKTFFEEMWNTLKNSGYWQGEIWNRRKNGMIVAEWLTISAVTTPDGKITHYVGIFSDITENKDAVAEIHRLAYYDPLTLLPNRRLLQDRLSQELAAAARNGLYGAILFLDLDNFKALNDTRGHNAGDVLLLEVARRLRASVREGDIVGRLGGDEFVVLLGDLSAEADEAAVLTKQIAEKILISLAYPYDVEGYEFHCTASIGVRLYRDQETVEELLRHADLAMYQAKTSGRNTLRFFDPTMQAMVTDHANMEKDMRRALELNQFKLYFQPQVRRAEQIVGAEVLLRWKHPERGVISPLEFIPMAEKSSLILPIGHWVLEAACAQLKAWASLSQRARLQLAINVSARQFRHPNFVFLIQEAIANNAIKPDRLKLELTESLVLDNISDAIVKMHALRELGVRFSLDDFGTGYSSFSYLTQLPFDQLKIDRSFVRNIGINSADEIIVQTIIGMANNLGIDVIAEGVETEMQRLFLEKHGCLSCQGFLFSEPVLLEHLEIMLPEENKASDQKIQ